MREHIEVIRSVTYGLDESLCVIDPAGRIAYVNRAFAALSGWAERVLLGSHISAVICQAGIECEPVVARGAPLPMTTLADVAAPFLSSFALAHESADARPIIEAPVDAEPVDMLAFASAFLAIHDDDAEEPDVLLTKQPERIVEDTPSAASRSAGVVGAELAGRLAGMQTLRRGDGATLRIRCEVGPIRKHGKVIGYSINTHTPQSPVGADLALAPQSNTPQQIPASSIPSQTSRQAVPSVDADEARERLWRQLEQQQDEFLTIAAHELKTPLTTLKLLAQMSVRRLRNAESPQERDSAIHMEAAILRMERLINEMLDISRIQSARLTLTRARCDLASLCRQTVMEEAKTTGREIVVKAPVRPIYVEADVERIRQVVTCLLTNALKYSQSDAPAPTVRVRRMATEALVVVQDEGSGIAPDALPHIFERFYRAPGAQTQSGSSFGLGLGLYITRAIIEHHGGRIWVESTLGKGSRFCFALPLAKVSKRKLT